MKSGKLVVALAGAMLALLPAASLASTTYYTAPNGSGGACTQQLPCNVVAVLQSVATSGDTVVMEGNQARTSLGLVAKSRSIGFVIVRG